LSRNKTDKVDSKLIAEFASKHEATLWHPLSDEMKRLKALERNLETFKRDRTQITNRLEQEKDPTVRNLLIKRVKLIDQQIKTLKSALQDLRQKENTINQSITLLESIPSIGETTAFSLLGELQDLSTFQCAKQLSAYAGLNPSIRSSGSSLRGRGTLSKTGSKSLRKLLYFPAMTAMRWNPPLKEFAQRLREKGKKPKVIIVAGS
jgi:transposase